MTGQAFFVLTALADGPQHGYGIVREAADLSQGRVKPKIRMSGDLNLEQRYRRVLRLLPGYYRDTWDEDMAGTAHPGGRRRPGRPRRRPRPDPLPAPFPRPHPGYPG